MFTAATGCERVLIATEFCRYRARWWSKGVTCRRRIRRASKQESHYSPNVDDVMRDGAMVRILRRRPRQVDGSRSEAHYERLAWRIGNIWNQEHNTIRWSVYSNVNMLWGYSYYRRSWAINGEYNKSVRKQNFHMPNSKWSRKGSN